MLLQELRKEKTKLLRIMKIAEMRNERLPSGTVYISKSHNRTQFYIKSGKTKRYVKKEELELAKNLIRKEYELQVIKSAKRGIKIMSNLEKYLSSNSVEAIFSKMSEARKSLIEPYEISEREYAENWIAAKFNGNLYMAEKKHYRTDNGELVRSKSELIIANKLNSLNIPYRYESPFKCTNGKVLYPDFTILDTKKRKEIYLEHFGLLDNPEYLDNAVNKLLLYAENGITTGNNLIVTFETKNKPFSGDYLNKVFNACIIKSDVGF